MLSAYFSLVLLAQSPQLMVPPKQMPMPTSQAMPLTTSQEYSGGSYQASPCYGSEQVKHKTKVKCKKMKRRSC